MPKSCLYEIKGYFGLIGKQNSHSSGLKFSINSFVLTSVVLIKVLEAAHGIFFRTCNDSTDRGINVDTAIRISTILAFPS